MAYQVKRIRGKDQIETCEKFAINQYMWDSKEEPKTYGWLGYVENEGLYVKMVCEEKNPKREKMNHGERVCDDSAMEAFLSFTEEGETLTNDSLYINYEVNANEAMYATYGKGREDRTLLTDEQCENAECKVEVKEDRWSMEVLFRETFLKELCDFENVKNGKIFYCNFYKISESAEIEHYGSFSPIGSETPNFHLPVFFAEAQIV